MAGTVTLLKLVERIRSRAKMQNSSFVEDTEIKELINDSIASLYDLIVQHRGEEYFEKSVEITIIKGTTSYDLPADFDKVSAVHDAYGQPLFMFDRRESNPRYGCLRYRITNNKFQVNNDSHSTTVKVYYIPTAPMLEADADSTDFYNRWERYVINDVAQKLLEEEESDASHCEREVLRMVDRIQKSAPKDLSRPYKVVDVEERYPYGRREIY